MKGKKLLAVALTAVILSGCNIGDGTGENSRDTQDDGYQSPGGNGTSTNYIRYQNKDIYLNGVNVAWLDFAKDFGSGLDIDGTAQVLDQVKQSGGNSVRWWLHTNGTQSPVWTPDGTEVATEVEQQAIIDDIETALDLASDRDMYIMLSLWSFDMLAIKQGGVTDVINSNYRFLTDQSMRESYIQNFLTPLLTRIAGHPALIAIDLFNEPENMTESWFIDREGLGTNYPVTLNDIHTTTAVLSNAIHDIADNLSKEVLVTTGPKSIGMYNADGFGGTNYYSDSNMINLGGNNAALDFYSPHYYDDMGKNGAWSPFYFQASYWELDKPVVVAEFFADDNAYKPASFEYFGNAVGEEELCVRLMDNNYAGAFSWQWTNQYRQSTLNCVAAAANQQVTPSAGLFDFEDGNIPSIMAVSETGGSASLSISTAEAYQGINSLEVKIQEPEGEKKLYLQLPISTLEATEISEVSLWVKFSADMATSSVNGGKLYAKDKDYVWSEGNWVNVTPGEWTLVSWSLPSAVQISDLNEFGFQIYGDAGGAALDASAFIDNLYLGNSPVDVKDEEDTDLSGDQFSFEDDLVPAGFDLATDRGTKGNLSVIDSQATDGTKALMATVTETAGANGVYIKFPTSQLSISTVGSVSAQIKLSPEVSAAGFTGGKPFAKTGDGWAWQEGDWVNMSSDTWTEFTWTVPLSDLKELGIQIYAGAGTAITDGEVYIDEVVINP
ncbi:cellulase family glycosylhydrolase [Vibrio hannami]|uniref:cellulase family glycosylhydrolase n=1 Tax=Vibrio hannami TaxID=2717094 RepID=UPI0024100AD6|nr:cellulase family glycosylhydrolase [Vibrio hannami]MDG3085329.1 cellulase family glycosylhydrolase [Vibrio hannami]